MREPSHLAHYHAVHGVGFDIGQERQMDRSFHVAVTEAAIIVSMRARRLNLP